jgi:hypothetical protein
MTPLGVHVADRAPASPPRRPRATEHRRPLPTRRSGQ